jgi:translation initiation factor 3 subunit D
MDGGLLLITCLLSLLIYHSPLLVFFFFFLRLFRLYEFYFTSSYLTHCGYLCAQGKGDLGKGFRAADFTTSSATFAPRSHHHQRNRRSDEPIQNKELQYKHDAAEDSTFNLVDTAKAGKKFGGGGARRPQWQQRGGKGGNRWGESKIDKGQGRDNNTSSHGRGGMGASGGGRGRGGGDPRANNNGRNNGRFNNNNRKFNNRTERQASVKVAADWQLIEEFDLAQFTKLQTNKPTVEDIKWCGHLDEYDEAFDIINSKSAKPLQRMENKMFYNVSTTDDPIIEDLATEATGNVYATDAILAHLMVCPRSVYPWDIVVQKMGDNVFFDKRDDSLFDYLTVSETATDPPVPSEDPEAINSPDNLSLEASSINQNFTQQILRRNGPNAEKFDEPNPFFDAEEVGEGMEPAAVAYRYRKFTMGDIKLVARCELHGTVMKRNTKQYMTAFALNEWDANFSGGIEWKQKIDQQRGAVFATELKNNSCKIAKWTAQSVIAGAEQMKIGYVSRKIRTDRHNHQIMATQFYQPVELAQNITLTLQNMWGIIKMLSDKFLSLDDGKFVIMKDPNKPIVRIYRVPAGTFEDSEAEEEEGEEEEEEED